MKNSKFQLNYNGKGKLLALCKIDTSGGTLMVGLWPNRITHELGYLQTCEIFGYAIMSEGIIM